MNYHDSGEAADRSTDDLNALARFEVDRLARVETEEPTVEVYAPALVEHASDVFAIEDRELFASAFDIAVVLHGLAGIIRDAFFRCCVDIAHGPRGAGQLKSFSSGQIGRAH